MNQHRLHNQWKLQDCEDQPVRFQPKQQYEPTMTGSKCSYAIMQLETQGVLHPDYHMLIQEDFYQANPNVVAHVMTQLSLKSGLK